MPLTRGLEMRGTLWVILLLGGWGALGAIYETDDRRGIGEVSDPSVLKRAKAVALIVNEKATRPLAGGLTLLNQETYSQYQQRIDEPLCSEERFANEQMVRGSSASGFLVKPSILITAGHVIENTEECAQKRVLFGYWDPRHRGVFGLSQVFRCKRLIRAVNKDQHDFAVIELDRPVPGARALEVRIGGAPPKQGLWMAGYPNGLSLKIAGNGTVIDDSSPGFYRALLDTFPGNSGGPVFGPSGMVEGMLIEGESSDVTIRGEYPAGCWYSKVYCRSGHQAGLACDDTEFGGAKIVRPGVWARFVPQEDIL